MSADEPRTEDDLDMFCPACGELWGDIGHVPLYTEDLELSCTRASREEEE